MDDKITSTAELVGKYSFLRSSVQAVNNRIEKMSVDEIQDAVFDCMCVGRFGAFHWERQDAYNFLTYLQGSMSERGLITDLDTYMRKVDMYFKLS